MRRAFSLLELLVVVAMLGLLAALLFPTFGRVRENARRQSCISRMQQLGLAVTMYVQDSDDLPPRLSALTPVYADTALFVCPSDPEHGLREGNDVLEGTTYLSSGVSYEYFPRWIITQGYGWWPADAPMDRGQWDELTPLAGCLWHWAKGWSATQVGNASSARGWEIVLTRGGSVKRVRVEQMPFFTPALLH